MLDLRSSCDKSVQVFKNDLLKPNKFNKTCTQAQNILIYCR